MSGCRLRLYRTTYTQSVDGIEQYNVVQLPLPVDMKLITTWELFYTSTQAPRHLSTQAPKHPGTETPKLQAAASDAAAVLLPSLPDWTAAGGTVDMLESSSDTTQHTRICNGDICFYCAVYNVRPRDCLQSSFRSYTPPCGENFSRTTSRIATPPPPNH
jgi:hypothetical protein